MPTEKAKSICYPYLTWGKLTSFSSETIYVMSAAGDRSPESRVLPWAWWGGKGKGVKGRKEEPRVGEDATSDPPNFNHSTT